MRKVPEQIQNRHSLVLVKLNLKSSVNIFFIRSFSSLETRQKYTNSKILWKLSIDLRKLKTKGPNVHCFWHEIVLTNNKREFIEKSNFIRSKIFTNVSRMKVCHNYYMNDEEFHTNIRMINAFVFVPIADMIQKPLMFWVITHVINSK